MTTILPSLALFIHFYTSIYIYGIIFILLILQICWWHISLTIVLHSFRQEVYLQPYPLSVLVTVIFFGLNITFPLYHWCLAVSCDVAWHGLCMLWVYVYLFMLLRIYWTFWVYEVLFSPNLQYFNHFRNIVLMSFL